jgi:hypothetical protein
MSWAKYYEKKVFTCDGHQFHQYQQNEQSPLSLTHCTQNKPMTYDVGNPGHAFVICYTYKYWNFYAKIKVLSDIFFFHKKIKCEIVDVSLYGRKSRK